MKVGVNRKRIVAKVLKGGDRFGEGCSCRPLTVAKAIEIVQERLDALSQSNFDNFDTIHQFVKSVGDGVEGFGASS